MRAILIILSLLVSYCTHAQQEPFYYAQNHNVYNRDANVISGYAEVYCKKNKKDFYDRKADTTYSPGFICRTGDTVKALAVWDMKHTLCFGNIVILAEVYYYAKPSRTRIEVRNLRFMRADIKGKNVEQCPNEGTIEELMKCKDCISFASDLQSKIGAKFTELNKEYKAYLKEAYYDDNW